MWHFLLFPLVLLLAACGAGSTNLNSTATNDLESRKLRRIAVFPLESLSGEGPSRVPFTAGGEKTPAMLISRQLYAAMTQLPDWQVVSDREVREMEPLVPKGSPEGRARRLGQLVYADAVISG
ncbi:MAG TPA: hypothetical protein VGA73_05495, partial [Candidatus Binatia bacterium]